MNKMNNWFCAPCTVLKRLSIKVLRRCSYLSYYVFRKPLVYYNTLEFLRFRLPHCLALYISSTYRKKRQNKPILNNNFNILVSSCLPTSVLFPVKNLATYKRRP